MLQTPFGLCHLAVIERSPAYTVTGIYRFHSTVISLLHTSLIHFNCSSSVLVIRIDARNCNITVSAKVYSF